MEGVVVVHQAMEWWWWWWISCAANWVFPPFLHIFHTLRQGRMRLKRDIRNLHRIFEKFPDNFQQQGLGSYLHPYRAYELKQSVVKKPQESLGCFWYNAAFPFLPPLPFGERSWCFWSRSASAKAGKIPKKWMEGSPEMYIYIYTPTTLKMDTPNKWRFGKGGLVFEYLHFWCLC